MLIGKSLSYEDVMLDWAVTEAPSPRWCMRYRGLERALVAKAKNFTTGDPRSYFSEHERLALIDAVEIVRRPILDSYLIMPTWSFFRATASSDELRGFRVIWNFPGPTLGDMDARWRDPKTADERSFVEGALNPMLAASNNAERLAGTPIAIEERGAALPRLIEGYGRCGVSLRNGTQSVAIFLGREA